jgi:hypothetical protein
LKKRGCIFEKTDPFPSQGHYAAKSVEEKKIGKGEREREEIEKYRTKKEKKKKEGLN